MNTTDNVPHQPQRWTKTKRETLLKTRIFDVNADYYRHPVTNEERDYFNVSAPDWVNIVALTPERQVVVVRQFRVGINDFSWEIPGGVIDKGEDPVVAGMRELREETAYTAPAPRLLASVRPNPAFLENTCHYILAENAVLDPNGTHWDHDEEFEIRLVPLDEIYDWIRQGRIQHSLVLNALLLLKL